MVAWLAALILLLLPSVAGAADVKLRWTWPAYNQGDSCVEDTSALLDLYRGELVVTRWPQAEQLSLGFVPANGMAGRTDSCLVELADSVHYATFSLTPEDGSGNRPCESMTFLAAIEARDWLPGLKGTYYNNEDLTAKYASRVDPAVAFTWGQGAPVLGMGVDTFSEHWEGQINFPVSGLWALSCIVEDGWRAWVNGVFVANDFAVQNVHESQCQFNAEAGWTNLVLEAMHHNGNAQITLSWTPPGGVKAQVPTLALRH